MGGRRNDRKRSSARASQGSAISTGDADMTESVVAEVPPVGATCTNAPIAAIEAVADRSNDLVNDANLQKATEMLLTALHAAAPAFSDRDAEGLQDSRSSSVQSTPTGCDPVPSSLQLRRLSRARSGSSATSSSLCLEYRERSLEDAKRRMKAISRLTEEQFLFGHMSISRDESNERDAIMTTAHAASLTILRRSPSSSSSSAAPGSVAIQSPSKPSPEEEAHASLLLNQQSSQLQRQAAGSAFLTRAHEEDREALEDAEGEVRERIVDEEIECLSELIIEACSTVVMVQHRSDRDTPVPADEGNLGCSSAFNDALAPQQSDPDSMECVAVVVEGTVPSLHLGETHRASSLVMTSNNAPLVQPDGTTLNGADERSCTPDGDDVVEAFKFIRKEHVPPTAEAACPCSVM